MRRQSLGKKAQICQIPIFKSLCKYCLHLKLPIVFVFGIHGEGPCAKDL